MRSLGIHLRVLSLEDHEDVKIPINKTRLKIAVLKWHPGLPGTNELKLQLHLTGAFEFSYLSLSLSLICIFNVHMFYWHYFNLMKTFLIKFTCLFLEKFLPAWTDWNVMEKFYVNLYIMLVQFLSWKQQFIVIKCKMRYVCCPISFSNHCNLWRWVARAPI